MRPVRPGLRLLTAMVPAAVAATSPVASAAKLELDPYVGAAVGFINNIELNPDGRPQTDDWVAEFEAGLGASYAGPWASGNMLYRFRYLDYLDADQYDASYNDLRASGMVMAVPDLLYIQGGAFVTQALVDPTSSPSFGNYFTPGNIRDVWGWNIAPVINRDLGYVTFNARYNYGQVNYSDSDDERGPAQDSTSEFVDVSLATSDPLERFNWRAYYTYSNTEYENFLPYRYDKAGVDLGWAVTQDWRLVGEYGLESDLTENASQGGLDSPFWYVGVVYEPDERNRIEARAGERFWGDSYVFNLEHRARYLTFRASYLEVPTTSSGRFLEPPEPVPPDEIPDLPDFPDFNDTRVEPYLLTSRSVTVSYGGRRTRIGLSYTNSDQEYFESGRRIDSIVTRFDVTREIGAQSDLRVWYLRRDWDEDPGRETLDDIFGLRFSRELGRDFTAQAETAYQIRRRDELGRAEGWWVGVRVRKDF